MLSHVALICALKFAVLAEIFAAALIDARTRRFPNALALLFALTCAGCTLLGFGSEALLRNIFAALACAAALFTVEAVWRRVHGGVAGLGGGDVKFLCGFVLLDPLFAYASFALGLLLLAVFGVLARRASMPLLPFAAVGAALIALAMGACAV